MAARYKRARSGAPAGRIQNQGLREMNVFSSLIRRSQRRKVYADLLRLDDHILRDIGLSRHDVHDMMSGRGRKVTRAYE